MRQTRPYLEYRYLDGPRPELAVPRQQFHHWQHHWAQIKKEGTYSHLSYRKGSPIIARNRHRKPHAPSFWTPTERTERAFRRLPGRGWYYVVGELLHKKESEKRLRDIHYIFDILVCDGDYLVGMTFAERQQLLFDLFQPDPRTMTHSHYVVDDHTWLAVNHQDADFLALFESLRSADDEGIVFKNPTAPLQPCITGANTRWQAKSRRWKKTHPE